MGLKVEEVSGEEIAGVEKFFAQSSIGDFREFFPVAMADFAVERFGKAEYFYLAKDNDMLVGAMHFSIQGGVGQLAAIQVDRELDPIQQESIRARLFQRFVEVCRENRCHLAFVWMPRQYINAIGVYLKQGFKRVFTAKNFWYRNDFILLTKEL